MLDVILLVSTSAIFIFGYVGFDVVCYNIEKGNRFYLSDR